MKITECQSAHIADAAALFVQGYRRERQVVPVLPDIMSEAGPVTERLARLC